MNRKIILLRHGQSVANSLKIRQGNKDEWIDTPLTEKGIGQAKKVAERLKDEKIEMIYSSDLKRAKETAEIINKFHNVPIKLDSRLRDKLNDESMEDFIKKCSGALKDIEKEQGNVIVVAHGSTVLTMIAITTGSREEGGKIVREHSPKYGNTFVSFVEIEDGKYSIKKIGCNKHLTD